MKTLALLSAALLCCASLADAGVNLYVTDCSQGSSVNSVTNACDTNAGAAFTVVASCVVPIVTQPAFVGAMGVLDVQAGAAQLPNWWRLDGCRGGREFAATLASDPAMGGSCPTIWDRVTPAGNNVTAISGIDGPNRVRFLLGAVLASQDAYDLEGDGVTELSVFKFTILNTKTVGTGSCAGCTTGACLVLNEIQLYTLSHYFRITTPLSNNFITYNSGAPACAASTPARNRTWGAIKSLYR
jgi:hypothetical protein